LLIGDLPRCLSAGAIFDVLARGFPAARLSTGGDRPLTFSVLRVAVCALAILPR